MPADLVTDYRAKDDARPVKNRQARDQYIMALEPCQRTVPGWFSHEWVPEPDDPRTYRCRVCGKWKHA